MKYAVVVLSLLVLVPLPSLRADFEAPVPVRMVAPDFPSEMRRQGISGIVMVNCQIDSEGHVQDPKVVKASNEAFSDPAVKAVKQWKFKPAHRDGEAVAVRVTIPMKFSLDD
ncbi:MAG TPA: energy transducer TonB [Opitutaceae bacterium]|jgi:protein TonB